MTEENIRWRGEGTDEFSTPIQNSGEGEVGGGRMKARGRRKQPLRKTLNHASTSTQPSTSTSVVLTPTDTLCSNHASTYSAPHLLPTSSSLLSHSKHRRKTGKSSGSSIPVLLLLVLSLCLNLNPASALLPYPMKSVIMDGVGKNECQKSPDKTETRMSGFIYSHQPFNQPYSADKNCLLTLTAPLGYRIRLSVLVFHVNGDPTNCKKDTLHVFDQDESSVDSSDGPGPIIGQFCGELRNGSVLASSTLNSLTLWWHTHNKLPQWHRGKGFKLLWTVFRSKPKNGSCNPRSEFTCKNNECIPSSLGCDRLGHCTDRSDLEYSSQKAIGCENSELSDGGVLGSWSEAAVAAICVSAVLGSVLLCVIMLICCKDTCRKGRARHFERTPLPSTLIQGSGPNGNYLAPKNGTTNGVHQHHQEYSHHNKDYSNRTNSSTSPTYLPPQQTPYCINPRQKYPSNPPGPRNYVPDGQEQVRFDI